METTLLLTLLLIVLLDVAAVRLTRRLLLDFLAGAHNRKSADRIHDEQPYDERLTLNYIGGHLNGISGSSASGCASITLCSGPCCRSTH